MREMEQAYDRFDAGDPVEARRICEALLGRDPHYFPAHYLLGSIWLHLGDFPAAIGSLRSAIEKRPNSPPALFNLATALLKSDRFAEALPHLDTYLFLRPDDPEGHVLKSTALLETGDNDSALLACDAALSLEPDNAEAHNNRCSVLTALGRFDEAFGSGRTALRLRPDFAEAYLNIGLAFKAAGNFDEAEAAFRTAVELKPDYTAGFVNLGVLFFHLGRFDEAFATHLKVGELDPSHAQANHNQAHLQLLCADFAEGWKNYEWRKRTKDAPRAVNYPGVPLTGLQVIESQTILVRWEQGLGDTIQFCRYAPLLAARGARVLFAPQPNLAPLMRTLSGVEIVASDDRSLSCDKHVALMSLPFLFGTTLDTIPSRTPYLAAEPARVDKWRARIGAAGFKIGICWKGSSSYKDDERRSFPVACFEGLSHIPGVRLISLHKGDGEVQLQNLPDGMIVETLGVDFDSGPGAFLDTAAVMMNLDLVITSDTSIAHLAGALGVPTWVALKKVPDWRWMLDRSDSPWYPTMRLFRQKSDGDWKGVFEEIEAELKVLVQGSL